MARISVFSLIPFIIISASFTSGYFDFCVLSLFFVLLINLIRKTNLYPTCVMAFMAVLTIVLCEKAYFINDKSFFPLIDKPITLSCVVDETPIYNDGRIRFSANMISAENTKEKFQLNGKVMVFAKGDKADISYGDLLSFKTVLTLPTKSMNVGGFDYGNYLKTQGIHAICETYDFSIVNNGVYEKASPLVVGIFNIREFLLKKCDTYFDKETSPFIKALLLGYDSDMSATTKNTISRSGISHVVAVSGMHLSIFMSILGFLTYKIKGKHRRIIISCLNILVAVFITILTGFSPSVKRAALMLIILNCANIVYRENDSLQALAFSVLILMLANPFTILDPSLSLSAAAVVGIIFLSERFTEKLTFIKIKMIREIIAFSLSAQISTFLLSAYYFKSISVLGIITNILILPIIPFIMAMGIVFLISPFGWLSGFVSGGVWLGVKIILSVSEVISFIPFSRLALSFEKTIYIVSIITAIIWLMRKTITSNSFYKNALCFTISMFLFFMMFFSPTPNTFSITAINVGQGDCTLLQFPGGKTMLIDGGGNFADDLDENENIITPYLISNNIYKIDYAVVSHYHTDHINGILKLAKDFNIGCIIAPKYFSEDTLKAVNKLIDVCRENSIPLYFVESGFEIYPDSDSVFTVLNPDSDIAYDDDNCSLVAKVTSYGKSVLFTGDIDYYTKSLLLSKGVDLDIDILKAPHHGDYTPIDEEFTDALTPEVVIISVGKNNMYGHPKEDTIKLYERRKIETMRTDLMGTIEFVFKRGE